MKLKLGLQSVQFSFWLQMSSKKVAQLCAELAHFQTGNGLDAQCNTKHYFPRCHRGSRLVIPRSLSLG